MRLLSGALNRFVQKGELILIDVDGEAHKFGDGTSPSLTVRVHDKALYWKLPVHPDLYFGEAYMDGTLTIENGTLWDFFELYGLNHKAIEDAERGSLVYRAQKGLKRLQQFNPASRSRKNVAHHYDLSTDLYELFLDKERNYSCAYFAEPDFSLEEAQAAKKRHIASKMDLKDGQSVLDIGSGWGGMAFYIAQNFDVSVTGVTLSEEQLAVAQARAKDLGLSNRVQFRLQDYRSIPETFDRIVSVGMFEHVGVKYYDAYFQKVAELLTDDGVALIHSIGRMAPPSITPQWLRKYIFPGGYVPSLSEVFPATERAYLWVTDTEVWRDHYAETLRHWWERFEENIDKAIDLYDERFARMWEFYLRGCEAEFRYGNMMVFQLQLAKSKNSLPLWRDYFYETEAKLPAKLSIM